jgi:protein-L-isoaspartate(D-aspartate) O-methyltransferase
MGLAAMLGTRWPFTGEEDSFAAAREQMLSRQLMDRGISDPRVLEAMREVPRHEFIPDHLRHRAYEDHPVAIGFGQTISQPYIVAFMTEQLRPNPGDHVLEIGTGCGYQAAVLSLLVGEVRSVEIIEPLALRATANLQRLGYPRVYVRCADGHQGWPEAAPYDAVIVACAPQHIPQTLLDQLKDGGRMIIPTGDGHDQTLYLLRKCGNSIEQTAVLPVRFVPMTTESDTPLTH